MLPDAIQVALAVARLFEEAGIRYLVGGSIASTVQGEPRSTQDVDFVIQLLPGQVKALNDRLERSEFFFSPEAVRGSLSSWPYFDLLHKKLYVKAGVYVRPDEGIHREEMNRARSVRIGDAPEDAVRLATAEDTVIQKLLWYRMGDGMSDRQWRDVQGILKRNGKRLDIAYLEKWTGELGISELFDRARAELGSA